MKLKIIFITFISILLTNCKDKEPETPLPENKNNFETFDRKGMLQNIGNTIILPSYLHFKKASDSLVNVALLFKADPSEDNLIHLQNAWKYAAEAWKSAELFKIGPGADLQKGYYGSIDFQPANSSAIESAISLGTIIDNAYIESKGTSVKGLPALEYLLFNRTNGNTYIIDQFSAASDPEGKRKEYVYALCLNLQTKATGIYNDWNPSGGNYIATFVAADGKGITSSISYLVNELTYLAEIIKNKKVGEPLGTMNSGIAVPTAVEAGQSESSLAFIKANIQSMENTFLGKGTTGDLSGLDDLLNHLKATKNNSPLSDQIKAEFQTVYSKLNAITPPLQTAVVDNPQAVQGLYDELVNLIVLIKVDMASQIGVLITIGDNDGD